MEYYREGFLQKAGKGIQKHVHSWRTRYFVLDGSTLKYYKCKEILPENLLGCINVKEIESVCAIKNEKKSFQVTTKAKRTYYMAGKNEEEIQGWMKCLEMAKEKQLEKEKKNSAEKSVPSLYDEVKLSPPTKPSRSQNVSGAGVSDPLQSPTSSTAYAIPGPPNSAMSDSVKPVLGAYQCLDFSTTDKPQSPQPSKDEVHNLQVDPTYDTINEKNPSDTSDPTADLYDTVSTTTISPSKKMSRVSDPLPRATVPPPLPARLPSMSGEVDEVVQEDKPTAKKDSDVDPMMSPFGLYEGIGSATNELDANVKTNSESQECKPNENMLYDEVAENLDTANATKCSSKNEVGTVTNPEAKEKEAPEKGFALYDEVITQDDTTQDKQNEEQKTSLIPDPTHLYAKPDKKSSIKRERSKRKLIPGLMDVGEVDIDIEEEAAGGKETLERGMTKPQGERFAIEELKEILGEFDREDNNNGNGKVVSDFDVNQSGSAFEVLRMFLQKYE